MKIIQINAVNSIKSTGRSTKELSDYLISKGHESFIIYSEGESTSNSYQVKSKVYKKLQALLNRTIGLQEYYFYSPTFKVIKQIKKQKPDIVLLGNLHASFLNLPLLFRYFAKHKIKVVLVLHDCWFYTGKCTHHTLIGCDKWKSGCGSCPKLKSDIPSYFFDFTSKMIKDKENWYKNIDDLYIIGVSKWITENARQSILSSAKQIKTIYNWIDTNLFVPREKNVDLINKYKINDKKVYLGVASRWNDAKGLRRFIELSNVMNNNEVIILLGNINNNINIELPENIINIKETHNINELIDIYNLADIFINLSIEESFGKTTAEALSCGIPVITLNYTANPELVDDTCGLVLDKFSAENLKEAIEEINKRNKVELKKACRKSAINKFTMEENLKQYLNFFDEIVR